VERSSDCNGDFALGRLHLARQVFPPPFSSLLPLPQPGLQNACCLSDLLTSLQPRQCSLFFSFSPSLPPPFSGNPHQRRRVSNTIRECIVFATGYTCIFPPFSPPPLFFFFFLRRTPSLKRRKWEPTCTGSPRGAWVSQNVRHDGPKSGPPAIFPLLSSFFLFLFFSC